MQMGQRSLAQRMKGAALLRRDVYAELERDPGATVQAALVVGLAAIASAFARAATGEPGNVPSTLVSAYVAWLAWAAVTYLVGDKLLGGTATWGELLRTLGFAQTPTLLFVLAVIPIFGWLLIPVVGIWVFVAGVVALREALDFGYGRVFLTLILGWIVYGIVRAIGFLFFAI